MCFGLRNLPLTIGVQSQVTQEVVGQGLTEVGTIDLESNEHDARPNHNA